MQDLVLRMEPALGPLPSPAHPAAAAASLDGFLYHPPLLRPATGTPSPEGWLPLSCFTGSQAYLISSSDRGRVALGWSSNLSGLSVLSLQGEFLFPIAVIKTM